MEESLIRVKYLTMDESDLNIWTLRITVTDDYRNYLDVMGHVPSVIRDYCDDRIDVPIVKYLSELPRDAFPKILCYREVSKTGKEHYHLRIGSTRWKTRKSLFDSIHKSFPFMKGQKCFSTKAVRVQGKKTSSLEKSITYISKDKRRVFVQGYSSENLAEFEKIGSEWLDSKKMTIFEQIIHRYRITDKTNGNSVCRHVLDFYKDEGKGYPTFYNLQKTLANIKLSVDQDYRTKYLMRGANYYDNMAYEL